jgi:hypothetical protein
MKKTPTQHTNTSTAFIQSYSNRQECMRKKKKKKKGEPTCSMKTKKKKKKKKKKNTRKAYRKKNRHAPVAREVRKCRACDLDLADVGGLDGAQNGQREGHVGIGVTGRHSRKLGERKKNLVKKSMVK